MTDANPATIAHKILAVALASPDRPALAFPEITFSYGQLKSLVAAFALRFRAAGLNASNSIHIRSADPAVALPALLAAALLGIRVNAVADREDRSQVLITTGGADVSEPHLLVDLSFSPARFSAAEKDAIWVGSTTDLEAPWFRCPGAPDGSASLAALGQGTLIKRAAFAATALTGPDSRVAVLLSPTGYHGLVRRLATLFSGGCLLESGTSTVLEDLGATSIILPAAGVPELVAVAPERESGIRCEVLGLRLARGDLEALLQRFCEVTVTLDLVETGQVLATKTISQDIVIESSQVLSARTRIASRSGTPARIGRLGIALDESKDQWIWPGIAARQRDQGLDILGPIYSDETIVVGGREIDADLIDGVISSAEGIVEAVAFASPKAGHDEVLCFAIFEDGVNRHHVVKRVEDACREAFGDFAVPTRVRPIETIPRRPDGQPDRKACSDLILRAISP